MSSRMNPGPLGERIARRELALGTTVLTGSPPVAELLAHAGLDFVIIDTEHASLGADESRIEQMIRAVETGGATPIVRVSAYHPKLISKALDAGAMGVIVPQTRSAADVRRLVAATRYPPLGERGACPAVRKAGYGGDWEEYARWSDGHVMAIPLIEERDAVEVIEEIAAVPGVAFLWIGPFDLSVSLGVPARFDDPLILGARKRIIAACRRFDLPVCEVAWNLESAAELIAEGTRIINFTGDIPMLFGECRRLVEGARAVDAARSTAR